MKKLLSAAALLCLFSACGDSGKESSTSATTDTEALAEDKGKTLIANNGCLACHQERSKVVGPAYQDVAQKYPNTPENLAFLSEKIRKGGMGNWGQIPMPANDQVTDEQAQEMARYILSIEKQNM